MKSRRFRTKPGGFDLRSQRFQKNPGTSDFEHWTLFFSPKQTLAAAPNPPNKQATASTQTKCSPPPLPSRRYTHGADPTGQRRRAWEDSGEVGAGCGSSGQAREGSGRPEHGRGSSATSRAVPERSSTERSGVGAEQAGTERRRAEQGPRRSKASGQSAAAAAAATRSSAGQNKARRLGLEREHRGTVDGVGDLPTMDSEQRRGAAGGHGAQPVL